MRHKWSIKGMLRLICTSDTYRQQSHFHGSGSDVDVDNVWLARGLAFVYRRTGPRSSFGNCGLVEPSDVWRTCASKTASFGAQGCLRKCNRLGNIGRGKSVSPRSLYRLAKIESLSFLATFDAPNREVCTLKRDRTNTPLQALVTLNDPVFVEAAQGLARRMLLQEGFKLSESERIGLAFRIVTSRSPQVKEVAILEEMLNQACLRFAEDAAAARRMYGFDPIGALSDEQLQSVTLADLAAWTTLSNVLLNLDEVLMTR